METAQGIYFIRVYLNRDSLLYRKDIISVTNTLLRLTFRHRNGGRW